MKTTINLLNELGLTYDDLIKIEVTLELKVDSCRTNDEPDEAISWRRTLNRVSNIFHAMGVN